MLIFFAAQKLCFPRRKEARHAEVGSERGQGGGGTGSEPACTHLILRVVQPLFQQLILRIQAPNLCFQTLRLGGLSRLRHRQRAGRRHGALSHRRGSCLASSTTLLSHGIDPIRQGSAPNCGKRRPRSSQLAGADRIIAVRNHAPACLGRLHRRSVEAIFGIPPIWQVTRPVGQSSVQNRQRGGVMSRPDLADGTRIPAVQLVSTLSSSGARPYAPSPFPFPSQHTKIQESKECHKRIVSRTK